METEITTADLWRKVKDKLTGFEWILNGICIFYLGATTYSIMPSISDKWEYRENKWFDRERIEFID